MGRPLRIALGDLSYISNENAFNLYVPLNIGYLASYAKRVFGADVAIRLFKDPTAMLDHCRDERPDLIGLSAYYWNDALGRLLVKKVRAVSGYDPTVVLGGPSIDTDKDAQGDFHHRHPGIDALVPNEGEDGFNAIVKALLGSDRLDLVMPGMGLSTDLGSVPSPYLDGTLEPFLTGPFQPMIQTSRLCPFTCSFCVSGKNRGKLRAFELDQVREELVYIGKRFADRQDHRLYITDENFGILDRDLEVAEYIRGAQETTGYPSKIFYYNDKRFTQTSRSLQERLGDMCYHGVTLSLQSENPETLKAIKRRNLTDEQVTSAIEWAHGIGLKTSTELIFGLPMETRASFLGLLDKCARFGFDAINCYNLIVFDGIEMNRIPYRAEHALKTKRRLLAGCATVLDGELCVESEEVVVSSSSFSFDDYRLIRSLNVLFHAIFINDMHRDLFLSLVARGVSLTEFLSGFLMPSAGDDPAAVAHRAFLADLAHAIGAELYTDEELDGMIGEVAAGRASLPDEVKIQPIFAGKLIEHQDGWVGQILTRMKVAGTVDRHQQPPASGR